MTLISRPRAEKQEGSIGNSFASLAGEKQAILPPRYIELKRQIIGDDNNQAALIAAWKRLITRLATLADEIEEQQQASIPEATFEELVHGLSKELVGRIKKCGSVVIRNTIPREEALKWLEDSHEYIRLNPQVKGFPEDDKQVFEIYWSKPQQEARSHPRMLQTQAALLSLFAAPPEAGVSLSTPLVYADRIRIRQPGDAKFALGPHMDGGSIERWEDEDYRMVFDDILKGRWEEFDAWNMEKRAIAKHDMYAGPGSTGVFRSWQGWTSLSETGPGEGTLLVYPHIREHSAYVMMRPLFKYKKQRSDCEDKKTFLSAENWELDFDSSNFPGSPPYRNQELSDDTHPHLELLRTMVQMPKVQPGDTVYWHSDVIHAVETKHQGTKAAAVLYIPAVALTCKNVEYIRDQRESFRLGRPAPDFPGGAGESQFQGRGTADDLMTIEGKEGMGLIPFRLDDEMTTSELAIRRAANEILGF